MASAYCAPRVRVSVISCPLTSGPHRRQPEAECVVTRNLETIEPTLCGLGCSPRLATVAEGDDVASCLPMAFRFAPVLVHPFVEVHRCRHRWIPVTTGPAAGTCPNGEVPTSDLAGDRRLLLQPGVFGTDMTRAPMPNEGTASALCALSTLGPGEPPSQCALICTSDMRSVRETRPVWTWEEAAYASILWTDPHP